VTHRVVIEEPVSLSLGNYLDDAAGLGEVSDIAPPSCH